MILNKNHPIVVALGNDLITGKIYNLTGIDYEVIDAGYNYYELSITNQLTKWKKLKNG